MHQELFKLLISNINYIKNISIYREERAALIYCRTGANMVLKQISELSLSSSLSSTKILLLAKHNCDFARETKTLLHFYKIQHDSQIAVVNEVICESKTIDNVLREQCPDLVIFNFGQEQEYSTELKSIAQIQMHYSTKVLVISHRQEDEIIFRVMQAGACGYVCKDNVVEQLLTAVETVLNGRVFLAPTEATSFFRIFKSYNERSPYQEPKTKLTEREREVLRLLVEGASNRKISEQLYITVATVKAHLTSIFEKFDVSSRTQAIVKAFRLGLV